MVRVLTEASSLSQATCGQAGGDCRWIVGRTANPSYDGSGLQTLAAACAARISPGEDAPAEKGPLERPIAVHAAAAEARRLAHRVKSG